MSDFLRSPCAAVASKATAFCSILHFVLPASKRRFIVTPMAAQQPTSAPDRFLRLLRRAVHSRGVSLREVARQAGVSAAYLSRLLKGERGVPADATIARLEEVLDMQPRGILFDAAGRHDSVVAEVTNKDPERVLMRSLAPLSASEYERVVQYARRLAKKYE
ncbi:MAG: helix-turn-helix transcriptional regulator [Limisphaerales bacterium]